MSAEVLEAYLEGVEPRFAPTVRALAGAVEAAGGDLEARVSYRMLMYARAGRFRDWICAIGTSSKAVHLRFLQGVKLTDPAGLLRPGSSTLMTIDYRPGDAVDPELVTAYVREAIARQA